FSAGYDFSEWATLVDQWRAGIHADFPARELGRQLVKSCQVIPMFHCWLGVNKDHSGALQNAKCNALGWFDFSNVWVKPEIEDNGQAE
ncbi:SgrR family transcriptional regulator, partial [Vibrio chemaguriensis]|nr:SgrR family transcriptional regulator [Vibrio chemaguriensis]